MEYGLTVHQLRIENNTLTVSVSGWVKDDALPEDAFCRPKVVLHFDNQSEDRRIPMVLKEIQHEKGLCRFAGSYAYRLDCLYWKTRSLTADTTLRFHLFYGNGYEEAISFDFTQTEIQDDGRYWHHPVCSKEGILLSPGKRFRLPKWAVAVTFPLRCVVVGCNALLAVALLPWFFAEALLALMGIVSTAPAVKTTHPLRRLIGHTNARFSAVLGYKITLGGIYRGLVISLYRLFCLLPVQKKRITFISLRRNDMTGNFAFVYDQLKDDPNLNIHFILSYRPTAWIPPFTLLRFCYACAVSKVIVLDEFTPQIHYFNLRKKTKLIQLWHACGAFKTFGFTRLDKPMGSPQTTRMHRSYDYVTVSSSYCKKCHAEGFGIAQNNVVPTGIPRTDVFFDQAYKDRVKQEFFAKYPHLQGKKILLFAPTFRGNVKETAHYPMERFDLKAVYEALGENYAILVKHHPFVKQAHPIPAEYGDSIIDLSHNSELNDLLLVSHAVITDYSSLIFEASLIGLNQLFYVYDLQEYIRDRDFYFDLPLSAPGKLVYTQQQVIDAILADDYQPQRMEQFAQLFFDHFDGQSSRRVADLIHSACKE